MSNSTHLRAANAVRAGFFAEGFSMGVWGAHVPSAARHYGLDEAGLSLALLMSALGALASVTQAGSVVAQFGARRVALLAGLTMCGALGLVLVPNAFAILGLLMFAFGAATALFDVAINAEGSQIEEASGRKLMSGFHGMFSLGGMAAAATVAGLLRLGWTPLLQIALLATAMALLVLAGVQGLPQLKPEPQPRKPFRLPRGPLALVGVLTGVAFVAEGAMYDWSALYLSQEAGASAAVAALGYSVFCGAMAAARFGGDWVREHLGASRTLVAGALLSALAMAGVLLVRHPAVALVGYALAGVGLANVVPVLFMAATRVPGVAPAEGIASVVSVGFVGFLLGPPLIGALAKATSLSWALGVIVLGALLVAGLSRRLPA